MRRWPVAAFVALAVATIAAFFITQHLKVTTPLLTGAPAPFPADINPVDGRVCLRRNHLGQLLPVGFRRTKVSFYLLNHADSVNVYILNSDGSIVRELPGSGVHMAIRHRHLFVWDGRLGNGQVAPDGRYYIRVALVHQGREVEISNSSGPEPITVKTTSPRPLVTSVSPSSLAYGGGSGSPVTITYTGNEGQRPSGQELRRHLAHGPEHVERRDRRPAGPARHLRGRPARHRPGLQHRHLSGLAAAHGGVRAARRDHGRLSARPT